MFKRSLAMLVIGSVAAGSCFANPFPGKQDFLNKQIQKMMVYKNNPQNKQSRFSGIWAGTCSFDGQNSELKLKIIDGDYYLYVSDFDKPDSGVAYYYNVTEQKNSSTNTWFHNLTERFVRINDTTLQYEAKGIMGEQLGDSSQNANAIEDKRLFTSMFNMTYTLNNNQLTVDFHGKSDFGNMNDEMIGKCIFNRAG